MNDMTPIQTTLKDWESDQEVRWCPGCGDYAILKAVQRTLPQIGADPAKTMFVSGIGCSSRLVSSEPWLSGTTTRIHVGQSSLRRPCRVSFWRGC